MAIVVITAMWRCSIVPRSRTPQSVVACAAWRWTRHTHVGQLSSLRVSFTDWQRKAIAMLHDHLHRPNDRSSGRLELALTDGVERGALTLTEAPSGAREPGRQTKHRQREKGGARIGRPGGQPRAALGLDSRPQAHLDRLLPLSTRRSIRSRHRVCCAARSKLARL
ncbi:hypothetical protein [Enhygromyxa salina]|uniref:hypothetical protein n=1 Tax=Enhygromyxa salina TaxID=215803 RepID=UPI0011B26DCB|nr:hypothetical protein [Enhygromyxa salina]